MARIVNDWRIEFMRAHPRLFEVLADGPERSSGYPLCEAGWRDVLERLCIRIETALQDGEAFEFARIKQKLGIARFGWYGGVSDETATRIHEAVNLAVATLGLLLRNLRSGGSAVQQPRRPCDALRGARGGRSGAGRARLRERPHPPPEARRSGHVPRAVRSRDRHADGGFAAVGRLGGIAMTKFRRIACCREGEFVYDPERHEWPRCGSSDVLFALGIDDRIAVRPPPS
jgi:hypothetical protein